MALWKERIISLFKRQTPSRDAAEANRSAEKSFERAQDDLARVQTGSLESKLVALRIREHNTANHYDDWLSDQVLKLYR